MERLSLISEFVRYTRLNNVLKSSKLESMSSVLIFSVLYLLGYLTLKSALLCIATICSLIVQLEFWQRNNGKDRPPNLMFFTVMRIIYNALKDKKRANALVMQLICGSCLLYLKEGMHTMRFATKKLLVLYDTNAVQTVLTNKRNLRKGFSYDVLKSWMKEGLVVSHGEKWNRRRKLLQPAFHTKILKGFVPVQNKHANALVRKISELIENQEVIDISLPVTSCVLDIVTKTLLGKSIEAQEYPSNEVAEAFDTYSKMNGMRALSPWLWNDFIFYKTEDGRVQSKCLDIMKRFVDETIYEAKRRRELEQVNNTNCEGVIPSINDARLKPKHDFSHTDFLLHLNLVDESITAEGVEEELNTIIAAAHDTTQVTICWVLYMLGLHEEVQKKVCEEIDMVIGQDIDRIVAFEDVYKLKYLNCVVKETLRLYPTIPLLSRSIDEDMVINGYKINKGVTVVIPIFMLHRNPKIFPNPEIFNPDRFSERNVKKRHLFTYIPFSGGPRNCIGQTFAMYQVVIVVASVLRHFNVTAVEERDRMKLSFDIVLKPENGFRLKFTRRNHYI